MSEKDAQEVIKKFIEISPLNILDEEKKAILQSKLFEIPSNALTHSRSKYGILCHGYYNNRKTFTFSIYDLGIGIPKSVREYTENMEMDSIDAVKWALEPGHSTKIEDYPRGIGFPILEEFRRELHGKITLITEDVMYTIQEQQQAKFFKLENCIKGTLFTLKISV